ncbi:hypothetical protein ES703_114662 [subsurface metagenome]
MFPVHIRNLGVFVSSAYPDAGLKDRHLNVTAWILEEVCSIVRLVRAGDDEVVIAIVVIIHWQGPGPETDAEVGDQSRVIVFYAFKTGGAEV